MPSLPQAIAFQDRTRIAAGDLASVAAEVKRRMEAAPDRPVLVFDGRTGRAIDLDLRGSPAEVEARAAGPAPQDARRRALPETPGPRRRAAPAGRGSASSPAR